MTLLLALGVAQASSALGPSWVSFTGSGTAYVQATAACRDGAPTGTASGTTTWRLTDLAWMRDAGRASLADFEGELTFGLRAATWHIGAASASNSLTVSVADSSGPVKVYDPDQNRWSATPVTIATAENNFETTYSFRLGRRVDFDSLTVTVALRADTMCEGTDVFDQAWGLAQVNFVSLGYW